MKAALFALLVIVAFASEPQVKDGKINAECVEDLIAVAEDIGSVVGSIISLTHGDIGVIKTVFEDIIKVVGGVKSAISECTSGFLEGPNKEQCVKDYNALLPKLLGLVKEAGLAFKDGLNMPAIAKLIG
jgi:hypothetical protein